MIDPIAQTNAFQQNAWQTWFIWAIRMWNRWMKGFNIANGSLTGFSITNQSVTQITSDNETTFS